MKNSLQVITILLALALIIMSINLPVLKRGGEPPVQIDSSEVIINSIMTRSSVRKYTEQEVSADIIDKILKAGMAAPTAGNRQPWEFYVVRDTNIISQFPQVTKFAEPMASNANIAIVVCGVPSEAFPLEPNYWVQDVSAASENILLATHALGLGAVWSGVYPGEERVAKLRTLLNLPDKFIPFNIIFLGHTDAAPIVKDKWKGEKVHEVIMTETRPQ